MLHAIRVKCGLLPSQYAKLSFEEQSFVRASVRAELEEENNIRRQKKTPR
ncbi:MAG: hypothetical protein IJQ82_06285 [Selenomonadaceae bacterium]|nr:hypothetical protein [Selenomonadaceae bacterium]